MNSHYLPLNSVIGHFGTELTLSADMELYIFHLASSKAPHNIEYLYYI